MTRPSLNINISIEYKRLLEQNKTDQEASRAKSENKLLLKKTSAETLREVLSSDSGDTASTSSASKLARISTASYRDEPPAYSSGKSQTVMMAWGFKEDWSEWDGAEGYAGTNYSGNDIYGTVYWDVTTGNYTVHYGCGDGSQWVSYEMNTIDAPVFPAAAFDDYTLVHSEYFYNGDPPQLDLRQDFYVGTFSMRELDWWGNTTGFMIPAGAGASIIVSIDHINLCYIDTTYATWYSVTYSYITDMYTYGPVAAPPSGNSQPEVYGFAMDPGEWNYEAYGSPPNGRGWIVSKERTPILVDKRVKYFLVTNTSIREIFPPQDSLITTYALGYMVNDESFTGYDYASPNYLDFPIEFSPYYDQYWNSIISSISKTGFTYTPYWFVADPTDPSAFQLLFEEAIYYGYPNFCQESDIIEYSYDPDYPLPFKWLAADIYDGLIKANLDVYGWYYTSVDAAYNTDEDLLIREAKVKNDNMEPENYTSQEAFYGISVASGKNTVKRKGISRQPWPGPDNGYGQSALVVDWANPGYCKKLCLALGFSEEDLTP